MNRILLTMALMAVFMVPRAWGATSQYPNPYRQTTWNNITDAIHTWGQSPQQAKMTTLKLHAARTRARLKSISQAEMAKFKARQQAWIKSQNQQ